MGVRVETKRLILRDIDFDDVPALFELDSNPLVHTYLGNNPMKTIDQADDVVRFIRKQYTENGIGRWAAIEKSTGAFIGWTGLKIEDKLTNGHTNYHDLGFRLMPKYWGEGYATESAIACLDYGFEVLGWDKICGAADVENLGSNGVFKKLQFTLVNHFLYEEVDCSWYEMLKKDWKRINVPSKRF